VQEFERMSQQQFGQSPPLADEEQGRREKSREKANNSEELYLEMGSLECLYVKQKLRRV
jgi:hypothetical protein